MDESLDEIACRMREDDHAAFAEFSDRVGLRLYRRFAARGVSPADAEELAVSILSEVILKLDRFEPRGEGSFWRWVCRVSDNFFRDQLRQHRPALLDDPEVVADPVGEEDDADAEAVEAVLIQEVRSVIERLKEPDRTIVAMRLEEPDRTYEEIGAEVGLKGGTVRVRHHRALKKLATALEGVPAVVDWRRRSQPLLGVFHG